MSIFPDEIMEKDPPLQNKYWNLKDIFAQDEIEIISVEITKAYKYGTNSTDGLYKKGILKLGETFKYTFLSKDGEEKLYTNKSMALYIAFKQARLEPHDKIKISREGAGDETRYFIEKLNKTNEKPTGNSEESV